jgi:hypothetical protein
MKTTKTGWACAKPKGKCRTLGGRLCREYREALGLGAGVVALEVGDISQGGITQRENKGNKLPEVFAALCRLEASPDLRSRRKAEYEELYRANLAKRQSATEGAEAIERRIESASREDLLTMARELLLRAERMGDPRGQDGESEGR